MVPTQKTRNSATWQIADGMPVYGAGGDKLGTVRNYDSQAGYLEIQKGGLSEKDFYLGWGTIAAVNADGVTLRLKQKDLHNRLYASPPPGSIAYNAGIVVAEKE